MIDELEQKARERSLIEDLKYWRAERPDEWIMDRFIRGVASLQERCERLENKQAVLFDGYEVWKHIKQKHPKMSVQPETVSVILDSVVEIQKINEHFEQALTETKGGE